MVKNSSQKGNAHVIIIVVLVVALISTLGFVFWQNFSKDKSQTADQSKSQSPDTKPSPKLLNVSFNEGFGIKLSMNYPENWTVERSLLGSFPINLDQGGTSETIKMVSPSKEYSVEYTLAGHAGLGGMCLPEDTGTVYKASVDSSDLGEFRFVEVISTDVENKYNYYSGLMERNIAEGIATNESACQLAFAGLINIATLPDGTPITLMQASIDIESLKDKTSEKASAIEDSYNTEEYKQAKAIILSTKQS